MKQIADLIRNEDHLISTNHQWRVLVSTEFCCGTFEVYVTTSLVPQAHYLRKVLS